MTSSAAPHGPEDLYASPPPWDIGRPQPAFLALATAGAIRGRVLDAGCGSFCCIGVSHRFRWLSLMSARHEA
jgi:hypothetical protein